MRTVIFVTFLFAVVLANTHFVAAQTVPVPEPVPGPIVVPPPDPVPQTLPAAPMTAPQKALMSPEALQLAQLAQSCKNQGPILDEGMSPYSLSVTLGTPFRHVVAPVNQHCSPYWHDVVFEAENLPHGATFRMVQETATAYLDFKPTRAQLGEHRVFVRVKDEKSRWSQMELILLVEERWENYFMPGVRYSFWSPRTSDALGRFNGVAIHYLIATWMHQNENRGPALGQFYLDVDLLKTNKTERIGFLYALGLALSFERNPKRSFLIPLFGLEFGGLYHKIDQDSKLNTAMLTPLGGLTLFANQNVLVDVTAGYLIPFSHIDEARGFRLKAGVSFIFW